VPINATPLAGKLFTTLGRRMQVIWAATGAFAFILLLALRTAPGKPSPLPKEESFHIRTTFTGIAGIHWL
jgi:hypothetical protein